MIVCEPVCNAISFEINPIFLIKPSFLHYRQTSLMELFLENRQQLLALNFLTKNFLNMGQSIQE